MSHKNEKKEKKKIKKLKNKSSVPKKFSIFKDIFIKKRKIRIRKYFVAADKRANKAVFFMLFSYSILDIEIKKTKISKQKKKKAFNAAVEKGVTHKSLSSKKYRHNKQTEIKFCKTINRSFFLLYRNPIFIHSASINFP